MINLKYIWNLILNNKKILIWGQIITVLSVIISVPIPLMLPALVDEVLLNKPNYFVPIISNFTQNNSAIFYIIFVTFLVVILRIVYYLLSIFITKIFTRISKHVIFEIRKKILLHLKKVCMNEYESLGSGAISANLITDVNTLDTFIMSGISKFITSVLTLLAVIIVIITIHPALGLSILLIQPTIMYFSNKIAKKVGLLKKEENKAIEIFQDNIGEYLDLFGQIKASNKEDYFFNQAINKAKNIQDTSNEFGFKSVVYERFSFTIFLASFEILRGIGLLMVAYSDLSIGMMMAMFGYIWFIMTPVQDMLSIQYSYATTIAALTRINKILKLKKEPSGNKLFSKNKNGISISIRNLDFSYNKDKKTLNNISLEIKSGEKVALIGPSGSGKTTLAQLIAGFYTKSSGIQKYNNIQIESISKNELRKEIFLVLQMPILFNNTLKFNITMGDDSISDEEIYNALELAQLKDVVLKMKNTINTIVGKNGVRLSGGQKQRLSIARMIIANASIIIFDESTSALDVKTETKLFKDLESFFSNKTIITIAHRLSTVRNANKIYMLNEGQIIQSGSHEELEKQEGQYLEFVKNQLI